MGFRSGPRFRGGVGGVAAAGAWVKSWGWFEGGICQVLLMQIGAFPPFGVLLKNKGRDALTGAS
jgi:hypothetical protein